MPGHPYVLRTSWARHPLWGVKAPLLGRLDIELTERCNNACLHCCIALPADDPQARSRELSTAAWQDILRQAADLGALSVRFTGGEPLLRPDFAALYLYARRLGLRVLLFTNARLITADLATLWARVPPLEEIEVTVYGMHRHSYEAVTRVPGSYAQFRAGVDHLLRCSIPFIVKGAYLPPNKGEVQEFERWAASIPWMEDPPSYSVFFDLRGRRDSATRNRLIASLRPPPQEGLALLARRPDAYRRDLADFCSRFAGPAGDRLFTCGAGHNVCVDAYGLLQPCLLLRHPGLACDLRQVPLREALTGALSRLDQMRATNPGYLARCARCFLKGLCEQCPAKSWAEHGTLDTPVEYYCQVAHAQARLLGLLRDGERAWDVADGQQRMARLHSEATPVCNKEEDT